MGGSHPGDRLCFAPAIEETGADTLEPGTWFAQLPPNLQFRIMKLASASGWIRSAHHKRAMSQHGDPLPWYTYGAIWFLSKRINPAWSVLEFGSGQSTLWWAARVKSVTAIEGNAKWYAFLRERLPANVTYKFVPLDQDGKYCRAGLDAPASFDVVVIDGRDRVNCARNVLDKLRHDGVIVWDNSDREKYQDGFAFLAAHGFKRLEFHGSGPVNALPWETSIFYRPTNCLGF